MCGVSKRTKHLLDLCTILNNNDLDKNISHQNSIGINHIAAPGLHDRRSPFHPSSVISPVSPWWDGIYEAADISKKRQAGSRETVKRKLTFHQTTSTSAVIKTPRQAPHNKQDLLTLVIEESDQFNRTSQQTEIDAVQYLQELPAVVFEKSDQENRIFQHTNNTDHEPSSCETTGFQEVVGREITGITPADSAISDKGNQKKKQPTISKGAILEKPSGKSLDITKESISLDQDRLQEPRGISIPVKRFPSHVKIYEKKLALNSGTAHVNTVGKVREARKPLKHCKDVCSRCEKPKLNESERESICTLFWNLKEHEQQWLYISDAIQLSATKKKMGSECTKGGKEFNRNYSLSVCGKRRKVCKTMFMSTLNISDSWIVSALSHCSGNALIIPDQRGKHRSATKLTSTN